MWFGCIATLKNQRTIQREQRKHIAQNQELSSDAFGTVQLQLIVYASHMLVL